MNKLKSGFFAFAEVDDPQGHVEFNWYHSSDHIPENLALDGVVLGTRWAAPKSYMEARLKVHPTFAGSQYLIHYLMTEPLDEAYRQFADLGKRTRSLGRYYPARTIHAPGHFVFLKAFVSQRLPISPEAIPFRPHQGVFVVIKDVVDPEKMQELAQWHDRIHVPDVLNVQGVAGCCWYESSGPLLSAGSEAEFPNPRWVFVYYLDDDPLKMMADLPGWQEKWRAAGRFYDTSKSMDVLMAGPYQTITDPKNYDWNEE